MIGWCIRHNGGTLFEICEDPKTKKRFGYLEQDFVRPDFPTFPNNEGTKWRQIVDIDFVSKVRVTTITVQDTDEDVVVRHLGREAFDALLRIIDKRTL